MPLKVLIVDDEALARTRLRTLLADCTAPLTRVEAEAANATQAVEFLLRQPVDVALIDIHMPGADGLTLARTLRTLPHPPAVVFVTAFAEHAVQAFEQGVVDYVLKPFNRARFAEALARAKAAVRDHDRQGLARRLQVQVRAVQGGPQASVPGPLPLGFQQPLG